MKRVITAALIVSAFAFACKKKSSTFEATVAFIKGDVSKQGGVKLSIGAKLKVRDVVNTGADSTADIKLPLGKVRLLSSSVLNLQALLSDSNKIQVTQGDILVKISKLKPKQNWRLETPTVVAGVRGTQFWGRVNKEDESGTFAVKEGIIDITQKKDGQQVIIKAGQAVDLGPKVKKLKVREAKEGELGAMKQIDDM